jgi:Cu+-exporting ATPase
VERASEHPLALAIVEAAKAQQLDLPEVTDFDSPTGRGALGAVEGKRIVLGNAAFLKDQGVDTSELSAPAGDLRRAGATAIFIGIDSKIAGALAIADPVKETTPQALAALREKGIRAVMLTGDNRTTAKTVAKRLGIQEVEAEVLPDQKSAGGREVQEGGPGRGDGRRRGQRCAGAGSRRCGHRMGSGSDVAIESAGVTLLKDDLNGIVRARRL